MGVLCLRVLNGLGMPVEWDVGVVVVIFKIIKGNTINCHCYLGVKRLQCSMKVVERPL